MSSSRTRVLPAAKPNVARIPTVAAMRPRKAMIGALALCAVAVFGLDTARAGTITKAGTGTDLTAGASWVGAVTPIPADVARWTGTSLGSGLTLGADTEWLGLNVSGALTDIDISGAATLTLDGSGVDMSSSAVNLSIANPIVLGADQTWKVSPGKTLSNSGSIAGDFALTCGEILSTTYSAAFLPSTPDTVLMFAGRSLASVSSVSGLVGGLATPIPAGQPASVYYFTNDGTTATFQMQIADSGLVKGVKVQLTQVGADIYGTVLYAAYYGGSLGSDFDTAPGVNSGVGPGWVATSASVYAYGCASLTINISATYSAAFVPPTPTNVLVFPGTSLATVSSVAGKVGGLATPIPAGQAASVYYFTNDGTKATFQMQIADSGLVKGVKVQLTQVGADIYGTVLYAAYYGGSLGSDFDTAPGVNNSGPGGVATSAGVYAYGCASLTINIGTAAAGTVNLSGVNTYTGGTSITGTLAIGDPGALGSGAYAGAIQIANNSKLVYSSSLDQTISGVISGLGTLTQNGPGQLTLTAINTYGGTTVNGGILYANGPNSIPSALGNGDVTVNSGGTIVVGNDNSFGRSVTPASSTITINAGGEITAPTSSTCHLEHLVLNGGTLSASFPNTSYGNWNLDYGVSTPGTGKTSAISGGNASLTQAGGVVFNIGSGDTLNVSTVLAHLGAGDNGLIKSGTGTLTLAEANTYTGATTVSNGTLQVTGSIATGPVTVYAGGTLSGNGTINGPTTIQAGGTVELVANNISTRAVNSTLSLAGNAVFSISKSGGVLASDNINGLTGVTQGGTITVTNITSGGNPLAAGDTFILFTLASGGYSGGFTASNLPPLASGLSWDTSRLSFNGQISVGTGAPPPIPVLLTSHTAAQNVYAGNSAVFSVTLAPGASPAYQWQYVKSGVTNNLPDGASGTGSSIFGATTSTLTISNVSSADRGQYICFITNSVPSATKSPAAPLTLLVSTRPLITQPGDLITDFTTTIGNANPYPVPGLEVTNILNGTLAPYLNYGANGPVSVFVGPVGYVVTPGIGSSIVTAARIYTATNAPANDPADFTLYGSNDGQNWSFIDYTPLSLSSARNASFGTINSNNQVLQEIVFPNTNIYAMYAVYFTNAVGGVNATAGLEFAEVQLLGVAPVSISTQPAPVKLLAGASAQLRPTYIGSAPIGYQWWSNNIVLPGATNSSLLVANAQLGWNGNQYFVIATNAGGTATSSVVTLTVVAPSAYESQIMQDSPASYWPLDESSGPTVYDEVGGRNGVATGNVTFGVPGLGAGLGTAESFDGSTARILVPYDAALNTPQFTIECWAAVRGTGIDSPVTSRSDKPGLNGYMFYSLPVTAGSDNWILQCGNGPGWSVIIGPLVTLGAPTHLVASYDGSTYALYVDGQPAGTKAGAFVPNTMFPFCIGAGGTETSGGMYFFNGDVDSVAYYPAALSPARIQAHYVAGTSTVIPQPAFTGASRTGPGTLQLSFTGPSGQPYTLLTSTNLLTPLASWTTLSAGTFTGGTDHYTDSTATNRAGFYVIKTE